MQNNVYILASANLPVQYTFSEKNYASSRHICDIKSFTIDLNNIFYWRCSVQSEFLAYC